MKTPLLSENFLGGQTVHNLIIILLLVLIALKVYGRL